MKFKKELFQMNLIAILAVIGWSQTDFSRYLGCYKAKCVKLGKAKSRDAAGRIHCCYALNIHDRCS